MHGSDFATAEAAMLSRFSTYFATELTDEEWADHVEADRAYEVEADRLFAEQLAREGHEADDLDGGCLMPA